MGSSRNDTSCSGSGDSRSEISGDDGSDSSSGGSGTGRSATGRSDSSGSDAGRGSSGDGESGIDHSDDSNSGSGSGSNSSRVGSSSALLLIKVVVVVSVVVVRDLACAGTVISTFIEVLIVDIGVGVLIAVPNMLVDVNVNAFAVVMTAFEFDTPEKR